MPEEPITWGTREPRRGLVLTRVVAVAWAAGRAMAFEQAVAYALEDAPA